MLAIRMQRTGRKGHAQFRIVVQEARRTPTSGSIVYQLGYYNPHAKTTSIDKEKASFYLQHGAQPSDRVARLLKSEGIVLPSWVKLAADKTRAIRHPEKLRKNQPAKPKEPQAEIQPAETEPATPAEAEPVAESDQTATDKAAEPGAEETDDTAETTQE